ncbi:MAG TPA: SDR family NAD(P)-dependent oxidoreductase, partial [Acidobacteriaceae bacterium]
MSSSAAPSAANSTYQPAARKSCTLAERTPFIDILTANKGTLINVSSGLAFVPLSSAPIYCATKAAVHSYTQSLRFQLEESGVEVIELMPPAVKTALS